MLREGELGDLTPANLPRCGTPFGVEEERC